MPRTRFRKPCKKQKVQETVLLVNLFGNVQSAYARLVYVTQKILATA